ncbi:hypothetical protein [Thermopirellula anaerolimosa]
MASLDLAPRQIAGGLRSVIHRQRRRFSVLGVVVACLFVPQATGQTVEFQPSFASGNGIFGTIPATDAEPPIAGYSPAGSDPAATLSNQKTASLRELASVGPSSSRNEPISHPNTAAFPYLSASSDPPDGAPPVSWPESSLSGPPQTAEAYDLQTAAYESPYVTREELQQQLQGLAWRKGAFQITPYGRITVSGVYETERTYLGDFALWVESRDVQGESGFFFDAKSTRLGLDIVGPSPESRPDIKLGGKIEFDFQGEWVLKNKSGVLFRQAYIEAKNEQWRFLFGQAWDLMSPLYPGMLNYVPGSGVGNLGYRRAQLRLERYFDLSDFLLITAQWSANSNIIINPPASTNVVGTEGGWPDFQGRIAFTLGDRENPGCRPITLGVSGHIGEQNWDFRPPNPDPVSNLSRKTWSFSVDFDWPITERLGFQCEFFTGENLAAYMGGILQTIDRGTRAPILSNGGWFDVRYDCTPRWHWHGGFSIDDPLNRRMTSGRCYNHVYYFNTVYDFTKQFNLGFEASFWKTHYIGLAPGETARFELQAKYAF